MQIPADQFATQFTTQSVSFPRARRVASAVTGVVIFALLAAFIFFSTDETRALIG